MSGSGISWDICKSAPHSRQITMPAPHRSVFFYRPDALSAAQPTVSKHWRHMRYCSQHETVSSVNCWYCTVDVSLIYASCTVHILWFVTEVGEWFVHFKFFTTVRPLTLSHHHWWCFCLLLPSQFSDSGFLSAVDFFFWQSVWACSIYLTIDFNFSLSSTLTSWMWVM